MLVLVASMLAVLIAMAVFSVDVAYMQLTNAELQAASDAAAKAAARELSLTDGDLVAATAAGKAIALRNDVAGKPLLLIDSDFEYGQAFNSGGEKWNFTPGLQPYSAVRITGDKTAGSASGGVNLFFAPFLGTNTFNTKQTSTASYRENEIVLAIDRSHSMAFDESGDDWSYPPAIPAGDADQDGIYPNDYWDDALMSPPDATLSRWATLEIAIVHFLTALDNEIMPPKVGVVTWASYLGTDTYEYSLAGTTIPATVRDVPIGRDYLAVRTGIHNRGTERMLGGTDTAAGIDEAVAVLLEHGTRSKKTMILLTDGAENAGRGAINAAYDAQAAEVIIHVITLLDADQQAMAAVASATGGRHIHAVNQAELIAAFEELAKLLPVSLID